ncbi:hypothetical protein TOK_4925 [Pseudonocardia sp. N23]|nr:hypothetical protein TOK_4925 [Pseudonocardia sp. N23]
MAFRPGPLRELTSPARDRRPLGDLSSAGPSWARTVRPQWWVLAASRGVGRSSSERGAAITRCRRPRVCCRVTGSCSASARLSSSPACDVPPGTGHGVAGVVRVVGAASPGLVAHSGVPLAIVRRSGRRHGRGHQDLLRIGRSFLLGLSDGGGSPGLVAHRVLLGLVRVGGAGRRSPALVAHCGSSVGGAEGLWSHQDLLRTPCSSRVGPYRGRSWSPGLVAHRSSSGRGVWDGAGHQLLLRTAAPSAGRSVGSGVTRTCCARGPPDRWWSSVGVGHQLLLLTGPPRRVDGAGAVTRTCCARRAPLGSGGRVEVGHQLLLRTAAPSVGRSVGSGVTRTCCSPGSSGRRVSGAVVTRTCCSSGGPSCSGGRVVGGSPGLVAHVVLLSARVVGLAGHQLLLRITAPSVGRSVGWPGGGCHQDLLRIGRVLPARWSGDGRITSSCCSRVLLLVVRSGPVCGGVTRTCCSRRAPSGWVRRVGVGHQLLLRTASSFCRWRSVGCRSGSPGLVAHCVLLRLSVGVGVGRSHQLLLRTVTPLPAAAARSSWCRRGRTRYPVRRRRRSDPFAFTSSCCAP